MNNKTARGSEDRPRDINPDEIGKRHPGKENAAQKKVEIRESESGRERAQTPADEHIETSLSQNESEENTYNDINEEDERDHGDSTRDWDAEHSRTGRNK